MPPGVLWVPSKVTKPPLTTDKFVHWYDNTHVQEVLEAGVKHAARYGPLDPSPLSPEVQAQMSQMPSLRKGGDPFDYPWLTLYELEDWNIIHSEPFQQLDGQKTPREELLERTFKRARFETRVYELVQLDEAPDAKPGPANLLISAPLHPPDDEESQKDFDSWYREEHVPMIAKCPGYIRTRRYKLISGRDLNEWDRNFNPSWAATWLALHEFSGENLPMGQLLATDSTEWSQRIIAKCQSMEPGFFKLRRAYGEGWDHLDNTKGEDRSKLAKYDPKGEGSRL